MIKQTQIKILDYLKDLKTVLTQFEAGQQQPSVYNWREIITTKMEKYLQNYALPFLVCLYVKQLLKPYLRFIIFDIDVLIGEKKVAINKEVCQRIIKVIYFSGVFNFFRYINDYKNLLEEAKGLGLLQSLKIKTDYSQDQKIQLQRQGVQILKRMEDSNLIKGNKKEHKIQQVYKDNPEIMRFVQDFRIFNKINGERQVIHQTIFNNLMKITKIHQVSENRTSLNYYIDNQLLIHCPQKNNQIQQIFFTWIKIQVQKIQNQKKEAICCKVHFQYNQSSQKGKYGQSSNLQFKDYRWPLNNESICTHLSKTIISFMNTTGGIIFVGLKQDKQKMIKVNGIKFSLQEKIDFLQFLERDILKDVYPKQIVDVQTFKKEIRSPRVKKYDYRINKYVHVDFLNVYNGETLTHQVARVEKEEDKKGDKPIDKIAAKQKQNQLPAEIDKQRQLYVARIKVKMGDPKELYHMINKKDVPQAYMREDKSVKKKTMQQFYKIFYDRIKNKNEQSKVEHPNCRFSPKVEASQQQKYM